MSKYKVEEVVSFDNSQGIQLGDELEFNQLFNWKELLGWEAKNKYMATSQPDGKQFFVAETGDPDCHRICCGPNREWNLSVYDSPDSNGPEVLKMRKPQECCIGFCGKDPTPCFADKVLTVTTPQGQEVATATEGFCICCSYNIGISVLDEHRYSIQGSFCQLGMCCPCMGDAEFEITDADGEPTAGSVVRPALTLGEMCGKTNRIQVTFPDDATQVDKTAIMGGAVMFDILEEIRAKNNDNSGGQ